MYDLYRFLGSIQQQQLGSRRLHCILANFTRSCSRLFACYATGRPIVLVDVSGSIASSCELELAIFWLTVCIILLWMKDWVWTTNFSGELKVMWRTFLTRAGSRGASLHGMRKEKRTRVLFRLGHDLTARRARVDTRRTRSLLGGRQHQTNRCFRGGLLWKRSLSCTSSLNFTTVGEGNRCTVGYS